jgi:SWI/SNF-related matrix-associated actin-dependent regulator 1 of chromatin subfamily A
VGSEGSWSGDEGRRKKRKRGNEPEVDGEGEAFKAFNEAAPEVLTGTIGESYRAC